MVVIKKTMSQIFFFFKSRQNLSNRVGTDYLTYFLKYVQSHKKLTEAKDKFVLVLSSTVVSLDIKCAL